MLKYPYEMQQKLQCTSNEKSECLPLIQKMLEMTEKARRHGLLALDSDIDTKKNILLSIGLQFVLDGRDPKFIEGVLWNYIIISGKNGKELIKDIITANGVLGIQDGIYPPHLRIMLLSLLGEEMWDEAEEYFKRNDEAVNNEKNSIYNYFTSKDTRETVIDDELMVSLNQYPFTAQKVFMDIPDYIIVNAICYCSRVVQNGLLNQISTSRAAWVVKGLVEIEKYDDELRRHCLFAQGEIDRRLVELEKMNEVVTWRMRGNRA